MSLKALDNSGTPQLLFTSQRVISVGGRTQSKTFIHAVSTNDHILVNTPSVILSENNTAFSLIFLKPIAEIKKANGFLQNEPDHDEIRGDMWLEVTTIQK